MYEQIARNKRRAVVYVILFFVVWIGIGALIGFAFFAQSTSPDGTIVNHPGAILAGAVIAAIFALGATIFTLTSGARLVLSVSGARPAPRDQFAQLHNLVEEVAIGAGLPKPEVYVIVDPSPNAFATGISPSRAAITATTGLLAMMNRDELEGVIAHEMSHIKNYDVRLLLIISTLIGMAALVASLIWRGMFRSRIRGRGSGQIIGIAIVVGLLLSVIAFIVGPLIKLALSRRREELADVSGVALTRNPAGLIGALQKLQSNDKPFAKFNHATASMCIDDPLQHHEGWWHHLFDSHPPIAERIAVLQGIERSHPV